VKVLRSAFIVLILATLGISQLSAQQESGYKLNRKITLGGEGGWDYLTLDASSHRLFVTRATRIMVVDVASGKLVGEIPDTAGVHGVALLPSSGRGVTSNGKEDTATIFDLKTLVPIAKVKTGGKPDAILFDPFSGLVLTFNGKSNSVTLIDVSKAQAVGSIDLPGRPETGVSDGKGRVFVNLEDKNQLAVIDVAARKVVAAWPLPGCDEPTGLAFDVANRQLFSACHSGVLVVIDADSGRNVAQVTIGAGVDAAAFDAQSKLIFTSNGEGTLSVIRQESADKYVSLANVPTQKGARTMALEAETHTIYTVAPGAAVDGKGAAFELLVVSTGR
jgi:DNA-binding beta-propeller fold protein YncE